MGNFAVGDFKASWVAIFVLLIIWTLTLIPRFYYSMIKNKEDDLVKMSRAYNAYDTARDGVLLLTLSTVISFAGRAAEGATNALHWVFFGIWLILIALCYFTESKIILNSLRLLGFLLIWANLIQTWATASGRWPNRNDWTD